MKCAGCGKTLTPDKAYLYAVRDEWYRDISFRPVHKGCIPKEALMHGKEDDEGATLPLQSD